MFRSAPAVAVGSLLVFAGLVAALVWRQSAPPSHRPVVILAAPTVRVPLETVVAHYTRETGRVVAIDYGPSEQLLTTARFPVAHRPADLLLPADDSYLHLARDHGLLCEWTPLATIRGVLLLPPGNPKGVSRWADLHADGVRVAVPNTTAAVGKLARNHLEATGRWKALRPRVVDTLTVTHAAVAAQTGSVDAAVVWDAVAQGPGYRGQKVLEVPELVGVTGQVAAGVLHQSGDPHAAKEFLAYLTASDRGLVHFREVGFRVSTSTAIWDRPRVVE